VVVHQQEIAHVIKKRYYYQCYFIAYCKSLFSFNSQVEEHKETLPEQINGPAIILFKGDNSVSCRKIHSLVEQAKCKYQDLIHVSLIDWSDYNPLIKKYKIRFLSSTIFINSKGKGVGRIGHSG